MKFVGHEKMLEGSLLTRKSMFFAVKNMSALLRRVTANAGKALQRDLQSDSSRFFCHARWRFRSREFHSQSPVLSNVVQPVEFARCSLLRAAKCLGCGVVGAGSLGSFGRECFLPKQKV